MKQKPHPILRYLLPGGSMFCASALLAQTFVGQWDFNNGTLAGTSGGDLTYADGAGGATQTGTRFGTTTALGIPDIGGTAANVMSFPAAINGMGYFMPTPPSANGGGSLVNDWTLVMDVLYPAASDGQLRPIIDTDGSIYTAGPDFVISTGNGLGVTPAGPYVGQVNANTWYRLGIVVTAAQIAVYIDGLQVGTEANGGVDSRFALSPGATALVLGSTLTAAAPGYINSLQVRDVALSAGQMLALGGPTAAGIPQTLPSVPSFIETRTPAPNAQNVNPAPAIAITLNQGDTVITSSSIRLLLDGAVLASSVSAAPPQYNVSAAVSGMLDPKSLHTLTLQWQDNKAGARSESWDFTVQEYQKVNLPTPFYLETFDGLTEDSAGPGPLPLGWSVANQTSPGTSGYNMDDRNSDSYKDWVLISADRFAAWNADRTDLPPIVLNGALLTTLASGSLMWAESDSRCGSCQGQYQELYTADINCTGKSNVFVAFKSIYEQNQDNMNLCEYSVDQGQTWNPVRYLFCTAGNGEASDIYYTNNAAGTPVIDVGQTFYTVDPDRNWAPDAIPAVHGTNYGVYLKAPISADLIPYIVGYTNDDTTDGKEIIVVRIPKADNAANVRFRFLNTGTSSWFWGIDDLGLYEINTPVITQQPTDQKVNATETATFSVVATSATALTYQWRHAGTNISDVGHYSGTKTATLTVSSAEPIDAGSYVCAVSNPYGSTDSAGAVLTVVTVPEITVQPIMFVGSIGTAATLSVQAMGRPTLHYQWVRDTTPVGSSTNVLAIASLQLSDAGKYQVTATNTDGSASSIAVRLVVTPAAITSGLVVHLAFDGNYDDSSGRANNATAMGTPTLVAGRLGQAMQYTTLKDGSRFDYATLGYPDDLKFGADTDFAVSFWVNYTNQVDDPPFISNKNWMSSNNRGWGIFTQGGPNIRANVTGAGGTKYDTSNTPGVRDGNWHHIALSYGRQGIVTIYVDGLAVSSLPDRTSGTIDTDDLGLSVNIAQDGNGSYTDSGSAEIVNGLIDDVGIWRRVLSPQEVVAIYSAALNNKNLALANVTDPPVAPVFTIQPTNTSAGANDPVVFRSLATGTPPLAYQWYFQNAPIPGATAANYSIAAVQPTNAGTYFVVVTNTAQSATSSIVTLTFTGVFAPSITDQPVSVTVGEDLIATFTVGAIGTQPLSYQWYFGTTPIGNGTTTSLVLSHVQLSQAGSYSVVVTNAQGAKTSDTAVLTVTPAPPVLVTGQWDFNSGDLRPTVGAYLTNFDATVQADTHFGSTTSYGIADIAGAPAQVLFYSPSVPKWGGYIMPHGAVPNGGGAYVNRFTIIWDVYYPASSDKQWRSLLQSNTADSNDADLFINTANGVGISSDYKGVVAPDKWNRIVAVFDLPYQSLRKFINGVLVGTQTLSAGLDGRWSLDPVALLFGDDDGDNAPGYANSIQFRNGLMTDAEVVALGAVTTDGIPLPTTRPSISSITTAGGKVTITWQGAPTLSLERNSALSATGWTAVPNSLGVSTITIDATGTASFFRLVQ